MNGQRNALTKLKCGWLKIQNRLIISNAWFHTKFLFHLYILCKIKKNDQFLVWLKILLKCLKNYFHPASNIHLHTMLCQMIGERNRNDIVFNIHWRNYRIIISLQLSVVKVKNIKNNFLSSLDIKNTQKCTKKSHKGYQVFIF
jgi:hypothetical protein